MIPRVFVLTVCCVSIAVAQHSFPLGIGDRWEYHSSDPFDPEEWQMKVEGDSLAPNGMIYRYVSGSVLAGSLVRTSGAKVFCLSWYDTTEFLLFDFDARPGDTMSVLHDGENTILLRDTWLDASQHRCWYFVLYQGPPGSWYEFLEWWIRDSLGVTGLRAEPGMSYSLAGAIINGDTIGTMTSVHEDPPPIVNQPTLLPNYPNPFNPSTTIDVWLPNGQFLDVRIFDTMGREVAQLFSARAPSGRTTMHWDASRFSTGTYVARMQSSGTVQARRLILIR